MNFQNNPWSWNFVLWLKYLRQYPWNVIFLTILFSQFWTWQIIFYLHCPAKTWIYLTPYVYTYILNEFLTADHSCTTNIFEKSLIEVGSSHLYASFGTFWVQLGQLVEAQWDFKLSEEFEIDVIFLRKQRFYRFHTFFKDSLCLE